MNRWRPTQILASWAVRLCILALLLVLLNGTARAVAAGLWLLLTVPTLVQTWNRRRGGAA